MFVRVLLAHFCLTLYTVLFFSVLFLRSTLCKKLHELIYSNFCSLFLKFVSFVVHVLFCFHIKEMV